MGKNWLLWLSLGVLLGVGGGNWFWQTKIRQQLRQNLKAVKQLVAQYPNYPDGWAFLAITYWQLEQPYLARVALNKAIRLDPIRWEFKQLSQKIR